RHGISRLPEVEGDKASKKKFKAYPIGFFHIDIAEVQTAEGKLYLYIGIDRTSKFAFTQPTDKANTVTARAFLDALVAACSLPHRDRVDRQWHSVRGPAKEPLRADSHVARASVRSSLPNPRYRTP